MNLSTLSSEILQKLGFTAQQLEKIAFDSLLRIFKKFIFMENMVIFQFSKSRALFIQINSNCSKTAN